MGSNSITDQKIIPIRDSVAIVLVDGTTNGNADATITLASAWPNSNLKVGQDIVITGTADFNGTFQISEVTSQSEFVIVHPENSIETTTDGFAGGDYSSLAAAEAGDPFAQNRLVDERCPPQAACDARMVLCQLVYRRGRDVDHATG